MIIIENYSICIIFIEIFNELMDSVISLLKPKFSTILLLLVAVFTIGSHANGKVLSGNDSLQYISNDNEYNIVIAALRGDYSIIESLLAKGVNPNSMLEDGSTPLICAAQSGSLRICKLLVAKGATINYKPLTGSTALNAAIKGGYSPVVEFLLENGADINLTDESGRTALMYSAAKNDSVMCEKMLKLGADLNVKDMAGFDPLFAAVINHRLTMITLLLGKGANANTSDIDGVTPLMVAVSENDYNTIELLLKYGADINHKSNHKETALTLAVEKNDEAMVRYLVKKGADVNQKLTIAETPLTIARYHKIDNFVIETLVDLGAKENALPDFRRLTFGPEITFNTDDFMAGLNVGTKEYKYDLDFTGGIILRPYAARILRPENDTVFFQYWERRNYVYLGVDKNIRLARHDSKTIWGITFGLKEAYTFGSYRGTVLKTDTKFITTPEAGLFCTLFGIQFNLLYQYLDFDVTGVSPHRVNFIAKFILGSQSGYDANIYKPWD
jgi:ankyrin repeat protein